MANEAALREHVQDALFQLGNIHGKETRSFEPQRRPCPARGECLARPGRDPGSAPRGASDQRL